MTSSFSALLAICAGNSLVTGEFPTQRPVTQSFGVFFDLGLNERLSKQSWGWWFKTPSRSLWRHSNDTWPPDTLSGPPLTKRQDVLPPAPVTSRSHDIVYHITVTSQWAQWCLKSRASKWSTLSIDSIFKCIRCYATTNYLTNMMYFTESCPCLKVNTQHEHCNVRYDIEYIIQVQRWGYTWYEILFAIHIADLVDLRFLVGGFPYIRICKK